jgi:hypothetical protein
MTPSIQRSLPSRAASSRATWRVVAALGATLVAAVAAPAWSREIAPYAARAGLEEARRGARPGRRTPSWSTSRTTRRSMPAAQRIAGATSLSPRLDRARAYSIRDGRIVVAENLDIKLEPPRLAAEWIDSGAALAAAEDGGARAFREKEGGRLSTMLLMRGAFDDKLPDETTWMLVYTSPNAPSLYVVVEAVAGKVRRTWRG